MSSRMLKKSASFVLTSLRDSTYRKGTPRLLARCGRADGLFEHPANPFSDITLRKVTVDFEQKLSFPTAC
jgi:hypothetical protein